LSTAPDGASPGLIVVSDLDGSLLDSASYSAGPARPALDALARLGVPLVPCTSKTRCEMEVLLPALGLHTPAIVENGGAIVIPAGYFAGDVAGALPGGDALVVPLGTPRSRLVESLAEIASETGLRLRGFSTLQPAEVEALTGLDPDAARRAMAREYDEPFLLEENEADADAVARAAAARGLCCSRGGRFRHLTGPADKGRALRVLLGLYAARGRRFLSVGLGDAENDAPMLLAVDRPILIPRPSGEVDPALRRLLPAAEVAPRPGPAGWNEAVLTVVRGERPAQAPPARRGRT
jgi:mannosyl-3-phosphoglycerate phosphatase family protein